MIFIGEIPPELKSFFAATEAELSAPQQFWLSRTVLAVAVACGRRNVQTLHALLDPDHARSALNDFFTNSPWPAPAALHAATLQVLAQRVCVSLVAIFMWRRRKQDDLLKQRPFAERREDVQRAEQRPTPCAHFGAGGKQVEGSLAG